MRVSQHSIFNSEIVPRYLPQTDRLMDLFLHMHTAKVPEVVHFFCFYFVAVLFAPWLLNWIMISHPHAALPVSEVNVFLDFNTSNHSSLPPTGR